MIVLLAAVAHAGLRADLDREARDAPQIAVACTSARTTLGRLKETLLALEDAPPTLQADLVPFLANFDSLLAPNARLSAAWWEEGSRLRVGFDTALDAPALAEAIAHLDAAHVGTVEQGPDGIRVLDPGGAVFHVAVADGWATVADRVAPAAEPRTLPAALLTAIPESPGCAVAGRLPADKLGTIDFAVHLSDTRGEPAHFGVSIPALQESPAVLLDGAVPARASTPTTPEMLLALGIGLDSIDFSMFLQGKELRQARRLQRILPITGGSTVAVLGSEPTPLLAAAIPFRRPLPGKRIARRVLRVARALELPVQKVDATHLIARVQAMEIRFAATKGVLYVSSDAASLAALEAGEGAPWIDAETAKVAEEWPILLTSRVLPGRNGAPPTRLPRPFLLTFDIEDGVLKGLLDVPVSTSELAALGKSLRAARKARKEADATPPPEEDL